MINMTTLEFEAEGGTERDFMGAFHTLAAGAIEIRPGKTPNKKIVAISTHKPTEVQNLAAEHSLVALQVDTST